MLGHTPGKHSKVRCPGHCRGPELGLGQLPFESLPYPGGNAFSRSRGVGEQVVLPDVDEEHGAVPEGVDPAQR